MKLKFLGSACWQGVPGQFCDDSVSKNVKWDSKDFKFRTSLLIETKNKKTIIVEISPDIRLQAWKYQLKVPDAFLISHWHWDHLFGLKDLDWFCEKYNPIVYGNKITKEWYDSDMSYIPINFKLFKSYESFTIDNIKVTPFEVYHVEGTDGFLFDNLNNGKKFAYLADLCGMPKKSLELIDGCDTIIVDATYIGGEGIDGDKTHFWKKDLLIFLKSLNCKEIILTHISSIHNLNHNDLEKLYPEYIISYDGLEREYK